MTPLYSFGHQSCTKSVTPGVNNDKDKQHTPFIHARVWISMRFKVIMMETMHIPTGGGVKI